MSKKNSLMKFSRSQRLAQLCEQESVIERKKREIEAKLEARRKKETEEALKILDSTRETKHNKSDLSQKFSSFKRDECLKKKEIKIPEKEEKQEGLTNAFSNDGSFLDHFKKISGSGLAPTNFNMKALISNQKEGNTEEERDLFRNKREEQEGYYKQRDEENDGKDQKSTNTRNFFSEPKFQVHLPPPGVVHLFPQQQNLSVMQPTVTQNPVPSMQFPVQSMDPSSDPSFSTNEILSKALSSPSFIQSQQKVSSYQVSNIAVGSMYQNNSAPFQSGFNQSSSAAELFSIQPPLPMKPQNIPPPSPIQVQNIPPPPVPLKETGKKFSVPLNRNKLKEFETDSSSSGDDSGYGRHKKQEFTSFNKGNKSKEDSACGSSVHDSNPFFRTDLSKESSNVSPALHVDGNGDDDNDGLTENHRQMAELVARFGDNFEDSLRSRKEDPAVRLLFEKNTKEYLSYRKLVLKYRRNMKFSEKGKFKDDDSDEKTLSKNSSDSQLPQKKTKHHESVQKESRVDIGADNARECKWDDGYQADNEDLPYYKMPEDNSKGESLFLVQKQNCQSESENSKAITKEENVDESKTEKRRQRKRKSRWGDAVATSSSVVDPSLSLQPPGALPAPKTNLLSQLTRSDPGLIQYARQTFGTTNLSEEDWKKAEDHYKINLLYQNMVRKRAEIDKLERAGKFKYEYDSDEDVEGGTWEHKLRQQEMMATQMWAEELTRQAAGKHHIGDFLPPEELERFMEKYNAVKEGREPDLSDYKEFKLKEDNVGYRLLQKMGWNEGKGLGQDGSGITNPVNKATTRHENQGLGVERPDGLEPGDDEYDAYRKRMMLAYRFRPNPLNNPRRPYY